MRSLVIVSLAFAVACTAHAAPDPERDAVEATVRLYFQGHATGDGSYFRRAFHPAAYLRWVDNGTLMNKSSEEFAAGASGKPADDEAQRVRKIALVDISGTAAIVKLDLAYPVTHIVDYLSLLKVDGKWVIVDKIFDREARSASNRIPSRQ